MELGDPVKWSGINLYIENRLQCMVEDDLFTWEFGEEDTIDELRAILYQALNVRWTIYLRKRRNT